MRSSDSSTILTFSGLVSKAPRKVLVRDRGAEMQGLHQNTQQCDTG
jgi:hypothetical protein